MAETSESEGVCRVCAGWSGKLVPLYSSAESRAPHYSELLRLVAGLPLRPLRGDGLPEVLCPSCAAALRRFYRLRSQARRADRSLRLRLHSAIASTPETLIPKQEPSSPGPSPSATPSPDPISTSLLTSPLSESPFIPPQFTKESVLKNGVRVTRFICKLCDIYMPSRSALLIHHRKHSGERPYKCPYCRKCYTQGGSLADHMRRIHSDDSNAQKSFACDICGKLFMSKNNLNIHLRTHTKEKPYKCSLCPKRFTQNGSLHQHMMIHTGEKPYGCERCDMKFITRNSLKRHLSVHTEEKNFKCNLCDKAVKSNVSLKKHIAFVHANEKPYSCSECPARFSTKGNLGSHLRHKHTGEAGTCDMCQKQFSNLTIHMRTHTGERPFECDLCKESFTQQSSLTKHVNIRHLHPEKFICSISECGSAFSMKSKLKLHILKVHSKITPHMCQYCPRGFYRGSDLTKHIRGTHHKMDIISN